jgi:hypothetical protein
VLYATSAYALKIFLFQTHLLLIHDHLVLHLDDLVLHLDDLVLHLVHLLMDLNCDMDLVHSLNLVLHLDVE